MRASLALLALISTIVFHDGFAAEPVIRGARVESCPSCSLNRLPEVKKFIYEDLPKYEGIEFKRIHGAPPELVLLDESDKEVQRIELSKRSRLECNQLLENYGFQAKNSPNIEL